MQTVPVKLKYENIDFFVKLLEKLNFIIDITINNTAVKTDNKNIVSSIRPPKNKPSITDFAGLWSENPKTLTQIREKAWNRN